MTIAHRRPNARPSRPAAASSVRLSLLASTLFAALALGGAGAPASAQPAPPAAAVLQNVVQLSASGTQEVPQDWLTLMLSVTREGGDAAAVQNQLRLALEPALAEARRHAQPGQVEVRSGGFNVYPRHNRDGRIAGWQGSAELVLEGRDFARVSALAARLNTLTVSGLSFSLSRERRQSLEADVQAQAIEQFRARAADITKAFGFRSYTLREVSVGSVDAPMMPRPMMAMQARALSAEAAVPAEPGRTTVSIQVSGSVQMLP